jgi:ABC-2 type transport system permease protein
MLKSLRIFLISCKLGVLNEFEYRVNFWVHLLESVMSFVTGIVILWSVYGRASALGSWRWDEILIVLGLWFVTKGVVNVTLGPSIRLFMNDIWFGDLDYMLTKPVNHRLLASTRKFLVFFAVDIVVGIVVLCFALYQLHYTPTPKTLAMVAVLLCSGAVIIYAFWLCLGTLAMWTTKLENIMLVFFSLFEAGRWPAGIYPLWLRFSLTFVVPIAVAITFPAEAFIGRFDWRHTGIAALLAAGSYTVSRLFFDYGVRHKYSGASA